MRGRKLLAAFLLGVSFCFVPVLGHGEVHWQRSSERTMVVDLLWARVNYIMRNPTDFLDVEFCYDPDGGYKEIVKLPEGLDTKGKIYIQVRDNRGVFSYKPGRVLLNQFKRQLEVIYSFIRLMATDMDTDIVAKFVTREDIPLGYFYQGEYHLWEGIKEKDVHRGS